MLTDHDVTMRVTRILSEQLGIAETMIRPSTKLDSFGADSLDNVEIVMALEDEFGVEIPDHTARTLGQLAEVRDMVNYLFPLVNKTGAPVVPSQVKSITPTPVAGVRVTVGLAGNVIAEPTRRSFRVRHLLPSMTTAGQMPFNSPEGEGNWREVNCADLNRALLTLALDSDILPTNCLRTGKAYGANVSFYGDSNEHDYQDVTILRLAITTEATEKVELKDARAEMMEIILKWAAKSRSRNFRGFRAHAVKELTFAKAALQDGMPDEYYCCTTTVVLSNAAFYGSYNVRIDGLGEQIYDNFAHLLKAFNDHLTATRIVPSHCTYEVL